MLVPLHKGQACSGLALRLMTIVINTKAQIKHR
jgi:hypothetical protein